MNANIVLKLNDGRSYVYGGIDTKHDLTFGAVLLFIGAENDQYKLDSVKEILIKPMPQEQVDWEDRSKQFQGV